jgi:predicted short-subunit dehydrogenase-like oxidoreductase (DUF2520 family)
MTNLAFIGVGRLGSALAARFGDLGHKVTTHSRKDGDVYPDADIIFLTVPDDAIQSVAIKLAAQKPSGSVVHCSGVHGLEILSALKNVALGGFHPLYPFREGARLHGNEGMLIGIEASDSHLQERLIFLGDDLGGVPVVLAAGKKVQYHAAASIASNYLVTLFDASLQLMTEAGVPIDDARSALLKLMQGNLDNLSALPPSQALTGPIARGDVATVEKHIAALRDGRFAELYRVMGLATVDVAVGLDADQRKGLREMLANEGNQA